MPLWQLQKKTPTYGLNPSTLTVPIEIEMLST